MAYHHGLQLTTVTVGGASTLESGDSLLLVATITATRSLLWVEGNTSWHYDSDPKTVEGTLGAELSFEILPCNISGFRTQNNQIIDVSAPGSYTHLYNIRVSKFKVSGGKRSPVGTTKDYSNVFIPTGDGSPVDLDTLLPVGTQAGGVVLVPDTWGARVAAAEAAATDVANTLSTTDAGVASFIGNPASATGAAILAKLAPRATRNILDYGVATGTAASQTVAIKAALDANPGKAFYFPPGDYRLDTTLVIGQGNALILDRDARIYAREAMAILIDWTWAGAGYSEDKAIIGGILDGALLAGTILRINKVIRFTLTQVTFQDGINRGLFTGPTGAEIIASDLRFHNTTISNVANNIAIEARMGDSHYRDVIVRDWTVAVKDTAANRWDRVHPWIGPDIGAVTQMTSRYPTSVAFDITGPSDLIATLSDTYRTAYKIRTNGTSYTGPPRMLNTRAMWADAPTLPSALAAANPGYVIDNTDAVGVISDRITMKGPVGNPASFLTGAATNLTSRNGYSYGFVDGLGDYLDGTAQGSTPWTPTLYGSTTAGAPTYTTQTGWCVVYGNLVTYTFRVRATLDDTIAGSLRIGGLTIPTGRNLRPGASAPGWITGATATGLLHYGAGTTYLAVLNASTEVNTLALRSTVVEVWGVITLTHGKA